MRAVFAMGALLALLPVFAAVPAAADDIVGRVAVIDGNTIEVAGQRLRLYGIDAPDRAQTCTANDAEWPCGTDAAAALAKQIGHAEVDCVRQDPSRFRKLVAVCSMGTVDINGWMVRNGWAIANREDGLEYVAREYEARSEHLGLWRGSFIAPAQWRQTHG